MPTPPPPLIAYAHVAKTFDGGRGAERVVAVNDVSLDVAEGEFLAIVGGSGSGKTTLLRMMNRLIQPDSGTIVIQGQAVTEKGAVGGNGVGERSEAKHLVERDLVEEDAAAEGTFICALKCRVRPSVRSNSSVMRPSRA